MHLTLGIWEVWAYQACIREESNTSEDDKRGTRASWNFLEMNGDCGSATSSLINGGFFQNQSELASSPNYVLRYIFIKNILSLCLYIIINRVGTWHISVPYWPILILYKQYSAVKIFFNVFPNFSYIVVMTKLTSRHQHLRLSH